MASAALITVAAVICGLLIGLLFTVMLAGPGPVQTHREGAHGRAASAHEMKLPAMTGGVTAGTQGQAVSEGARL